MTFAIDWHSIAELEPPKNISLLFKTDIAGTYAGFYEGNHCFRSPIGDNKVKYFYSQDTDLVVSSIATGKIRTIGDSKKSILENGNVTHWNIPC